MDTVAQCTSLAPQILGFIFFELFSNLGRTGCRRGRTPERPLRQPSQGLADRAGPFVCSRSRIARAWNPPTSSSLAEEKRLRSVLLSTAGARFPTLAADSSCRTDPRSQIDIAKCCAAGKFRSTVVFGSFPFRYLTRGGGTPRGKNSVASDVSLGSRVRLPNSAGRAPCRECPGRKRRWEPSDFSHVRTERFPG